MKLQKIRVEEVQQSFLLSNKCKDIERCKNECLKIATKRKDGIWYITGSSLNETS